MLASWQLAALLYDASSFDDIAVNRLPVSVCGVMARALAGQPIVAGMQSELARRLRYELQPAWIKTADLATVALVLDGLQACSPSSITGDDVALFVARLVAAETAVGGPYRQSGRPEQSDSSLDIVANAAIARCMVWMAAPLPNVTAYLMDNLNDSDLVDPEDWLLLAALQQPIDNLLHTCVAGQLLTYIVNLNTITCRQILQSAGLEGNDGDGIQANDVLPDGSQDEPARLIHDYCLGTLPKFSEPFYGYTHTMLSQVLGVDSDNEISQLAWYYGQALAGPAKAGVDMNQYLQLGTANVYAWAAYTIYDDFLDDEGRPTLLGTANYCLRAMMYHYQKAVPDRGFQTFVKHCLAVVDQANALETARYRLAVTGRAITIGALPDYAARDLLADRALFHILGPMAVLSTTGRATIGDSVWEHTLQAFRHYLIARQLNDDIHDWVKDLMAGQASYVVVELLKYLNITPGCYILDRLMPFAREQFWQYVLPKICRTALDHIAAGRQHLQQGLQLTAKNQLVSLFDYVEESMLAAEAKRLRSQGLLRAFNTKI